MTKHSTEEFRQIAERGTILRCLVGSNVHGVNIAEQDDRDEMGICIEPPEYVIGLRQFDQYIYRTQPEGHRSGPGDLDLTVYSLRKWMRLALAGNPTVLLPLFVARAHIVAIDQAGRNLRDRRGMILSREAGYRFRGYLQAQRERLLGLRGGMDCNRTELIEAYGFDTKFAGHMVRLGIQGCELLETGRITLPVPEPWRTWIKDLRVGKHTRDEALEAAADSEARLEGLLKTSPLPEHPDRAFADAWMIAAYQHAWEGKWVAS